MENILLEGKKSLEEAINSKQTIKYILSSNKDICEKYSNYDVYFVSDAIMKKVSTTDSPASVVAVIKKPSYSIDLFKKYKKIVLLDGIKDAGNLGTIIRACSAFSVEGILLYNDTVDEFSPKTIRSAAGNIFKLPILKIDDKELLKLKKTHKFLACVVNSNKYLDKYKHPEFLVVMFGSEAEGLCKKLLNLSDDFVTIKMSNNVESLNLALSSAIVLYELQK